MQKLQSMIFGNHYTPFACNLIATSTRWTFVDNAYVKYITNPMPTLNVKHTISLDITSTSQVLTIDNIANTYSETPTGVASNIMIFARNTNKGFGTNGNNAYMKLYYFKIYLNNVLVRDYYPVLDNNGVACLFDATTNTFAYNQGVGDFFCYETGLIFDRTQADVTNATLKGQYNPSDLNRVERWCRKLADDLTVAGYPINITTKDDWFVTDLRDNTNMERIRQNILKLMTGYHFITKIYTASNTMTYIRANNYEKILDEIYYMFFGMENWQVHSGVANSGQNRMWQNRYRNVIKDSVVPQYIPIEYIESTGTQYIDTGIVPSATIKIISKQSQNVVNSQQGCEYTSSYRYRWGTNGSSQLYLGFGGSNLASSGNYEPNKPYIYVLERGNQKVYDAEGNVLVTGSVTSNTYNTSSIPIFALKRGATISQYHKLRQYYYQIYDNGTLLRDFVPALDMNLTPCLYEKVTNTFYYNQGTGEFYAGKGRTCNYIESTGTQYIDTGFKPNQNSRIDIAIDTTNCVNMNYPSPFGSRGNGTTGDTNIDLFTLGIQYPGSASTINWWLKYGTISATVDTTYGNKYGFNQCVIDKNKYTINGKTYTFEAQTFQSINNMFLFGYNYNGSLGNGDNGKFKGKIFYAKIYDNGTLVRDLIPMLNSNLEPCLYDRVNNQYYTNAGTGTFLYG